MRIIPDFDLTTSNSYQVKSRCKRAFFPDSIIEVIQAFQDEGGVKKIILGNGNNHILSKDYYEEDFIIFNGNFDRITINSNKILCEAGGTLAQLSEMALENSLTGAETFWDIPSSIGGAVVMNAGASGDEIKDILISAKYLNRETLAVEEIENASIGFGYRNSFFKNPQHLVLEAIFALNKGEQSLILEKMKNTKTARWSKQPRNYPNCGSVFKRPEGMYVGPMLDELKLKGFTVGGAQVSEKHSGFIVNIGNATGKDILNLIKIIQERVHEKFDVFLEVEQRII